MTADDHDGAADDPAEPTPTDPSDVDAAFAGIVAGWDLRLPDDEDDDEDGARVAPRESPRGPGTFEELRAWVDVDPDLLRIDDADDDVDHGSGVDEESHYVPPPPPPVPRGDRVARWAWGGAVGGPIGYVGMSLAGMDTGGPLGVVLIGAFAAGFVTLVVRMKDGPRVDDGPDDGAVV